MKKISKEMAEKMKSYFNLTKEITEFLQDDCGLEGMNLPEAAFCKEPKGDLQRDGSYCYQKQLHEDWFVGSVYLPIESSEEWLEVPYEIC